MNENEFQFRTAALGGFHKQDVLSYLERSAKEHWEEKGEMERRQALLEEENQRLAADLADREAALADATAGKETAERQEAALQEEAEKLRPAAKAYEAVKDRTASIELEAHGRAQAIEEEGRQKAKKHQQVVQDEALKIIKEQIDQMDPKPPQPLPIEEDN